MQLLSSARIIAIILVLCAFYFASSVLVPFVLALFVAILLDPIVVALKKMGIARTVGTSLTVAAFFCILIAGGKYVFRASTQAMEQAPQYLAEAKKFATMISNRTAAIKTEATEVSTGPSVARVPTPGDIQKVEVVEGFSSWRTVLLRMVGSAFEIMSLAFFVPLLIFYFLIDKSNLLESFNTLAGRIFYLPKLNTDLPKMIQAFVRGNLVGGVILVALHAVLFFSLGLHNGIGLAFISGFLNLIPLIGAPLALVLPLAQAIVQWNDPWLFFGLAAAIVLFHFIVGNVVLPQVIGSRINVNSASLVLGLLFWGWMWGAMGFLLAIPLTSTLKIFLESNLRTRPLANLLAAKPRHVIPRKSSSLRSQPGEETLIDPVYKPPTDSSV